MVGTFVEEIKSFASPALADKIACRWESERQESFSISFAKMQRLCVRFASMLHKQGVGEGDVVPIFLPNLPETLAALISCAQIGAHPLILDCTKPQLVADILEKTAATILITADATFINGVYLPLKEEVDQILPAFVDKVIVIKRMEGSCHLVHKRDYWFHEVMARAPHIQPEKASRGDFLYIQEGRLNTCSGQDFFDKLEKVQVEREGIYFCKHPLHSLEGQVISYSLMHQGAQQILFEGAPNQLERFIEIA